MLALLLAAPLAALMVSSEGSAGPLTEMPGFFRIGDGDDERATAGVSAGIPLAAAGSDAPAFRLAPNGQIVLGRRGLPPGYREATVLLQRLNVGDGEPRKLLARLRRLIGEMRVGDLRDLERALKEKILLLRRSGASSENQLVEQLRGLLRVVRREIASRTGSGGASARTATASAGSGTPAGSGGSGATNSGGSSGTAGGSPTSASGGGGRSFTRQGSTGGSSGGGGGGSGSGGGSSGGGSSGGGGTVGGGTGGGGGTTPSGGGGGGATGGGTVQAPAPSSPPVSDGGGGTGNGRGNSGNGTGNGGGDGNRRGKGGGGD